MAKPLPQVWAVCHPKKDVLDESFLVSELALDLYAVAICMPRSLLSEQFCKSCEESRDRSFFGIRQPCASHFEPNAIKLP
jgi:hypothetical protein